MTDALLLVNTARHRYAVRRDDVLAVELVADATVAPPESHVYIELGALLDPADCSALRRRRALLVPARRRRVALLVDHVEIIEHAPSTIPMPPLLAARLRQPWAVGVLIIDSTLCIQLDLRAVARSALSNLQTLR